MSFWLWIFVGVVVFVLYKLFQFDGDFTVLSSQLKKVYFKGRVVWVTGASSGSEMNRRSIKLGIFAELHLLPRDSLHSLKCISTCTSE